MEPMGHIEESKVRTSYQRTNSFPPSERNNDLLSPLKNRRSSLSAPKRSFDVELRFSSLQLFGRDEDMKILQNVHKRARRKQISDGNESSSNEVVLLHGHSGTGKSALVRSFSDTVISTGSLFASGKFDKRKQHEPYTAIVSVLNDLCDHATVATSNSDASIPSSSVLRIRSDICDAIGSEGAPLMEIAPKLSQLLVEGQIQNQKNDNIAAACRGSRLNFLIRGFVRAFCNHKTLVLFLDDIQWADMASLKLIKTICSDSDNSGLIVILSCRDGETEYSNQQLVSFLHDIKTSNGIAATMMTLSNLDAKAVNMLLADVLMTSEEKTHNLANIIHRKTHGNAFAVVHFIRNMKDEGLLMFCFGTLSWKWNENEVRSCMSITENVVDILTCKIREKLPESVREVLKIASCLGGTFDLSTLLFVVEDVRIEMERSQSEILSSEGNKKSDSLMLCLDFCVDEGLLERDEKDCYRFSHDQVSSATFSLIPEKLRDSILFHIGEALLKRYSHVELENNIFVVTGLLNHGIKLISRDNKKCNLLSKLNLQAGKKAMKSSALESAASYTKIAIDLLQVSHDSWRDIPDLCVELYSTAAQIEYCLGHIERVEVYLGELFQQHLPIEDKIEAYKLEIHSMHFIGNKHHKAIDLALSVLSQLGVRLPNAPLKPVILKEIFRTRYIVNRYSYEKLSVLPTMTDRKKLCVMQILGVLVQLTFGIKPAHFVLVILKMVQYSVKYGVSKYSSHAFVSYGMIMVNMVKDFHESDKFGQLAIIFLKRFQASDMESHVVFICCQFVSHWSEPLHLLQKRSFDAYEIGMRTGDINYALLSLRTSIQFSQLVGKPLPLIDAEIKSSIEIMKDLKHERVVNFLLPIWQFNLNLMEKPPDPKVLTGSVMKQDDLLKSTAKSGDHAVKYVVKIYQIWASFYFGEFEHVGALMGELTQANNILRSTPTLWRSALYEGLTAFALARKNNSSKWKKHALMVKSKVQKWVKKGNVNCNHILLIFEAEISVLEGNTGAAKQKYETAISATARYGLTHDRALTHERAGEFMLEKGDRYFAFHHLKLAHELYLRWGAKAKADHLYCAHKQLLEQYWNEE